MPTEQRLKTEMPRLVYAGNRAIAVRGLELLRRAGIEPVALLLPERLDGEHNEKMRACVSADTPVIEGKSFKAPDALARLKSLSPDYILSVHFPYVFPAELLSMARIGTLNLHPAFLPYNRGWHTPSWAIIEGTPIGATLHWVDEGVDTGDIALQRSVTIQPKDTAHSLYQRIIEAELELLEAVLPLLKMGQLPRHSQEGAGTVHRKADLASVQPLDLEKRMRVGDVLDLLRGLTTNALHEAAYFDVSGHRYCVRIEITEV